MTEYIVIVEPSANGFGAYVPDLPGCVAVGETREETLELVREAIQFHIESLRDHNETVPAPHTTVERIAV
ncbi:MAG: type II toxin-antitoxin system HicB family antitoxin [Thermoanaerobaculia bacterium]